MAKERHSLNPAKVKRDARALAAIGKSRRVATFLELRRRLTIVLLGLLTGALLTVSFAPWDVWPAAYVALVPWVLALIFAPTRRWALLSAWLTGLAFWAVSLYWLTWITLVGYIAGVLYISLHWLAVAAILRAAMRRRWPMWIVLPVVWVAFEYVRAHVLVEFPWFFLAHTQYTRARLIQIADVTGQYGVSFFVAMVNGALVELAIWLLLLRGERHSRSRVIRAAAAPVVVAVGLLLYGCWQLGRDTLREGPVIGLVQQAYPISLTGRDVGPEEILDSHVAATAGFVGRPMDLVIWPETMLPRGMNDEVLNIDVAKLSGDDLRALAARFFGPPVWEVDSEDLIRQHLRLVIEGGPGPRGEEVIGLRRQAGRVRQLARKLHCPILAGGATLHRNAQPAFSADWWVVRNGTVWFDPNGQPGPTYAKRHLVPFSEYVPLKRGWPGLHRLLRRFVPDVMEQLEPGEAYTRFVLDRPAGRWRLVSPICYEGTFARVCREMVNEGGRKRADILANLSNDGWFVCHWGRGRRTGSSEHSQHLSHYCFRAVENRLPVVRAVNTGISASIDANGRIVAEIRHGSMRTMIPGTLTLDGARRNEREYLPGHGPKVLVDSRTSWYSRVGDLFAAAVTLAAAVMVIWLRWKQPGGTEGVSN